jgi:hypothetical protein
MDRQLSFFVLSLLLSTDGRVEDEKEWDERRWGKPSWETGT